MDAEVLPAAVTRILNRTTRNPETGCWECGFTPDGHGYVTIRFGRSRRAYRTYKVHRIIYVVFCGDPTGNVVAHRCDNPKCCNPVHLFLTNPAGNTADMDAKGRRPTTRRTHAERRAIRATAFQRLDAGRSISCVARELKVAYSQMSKWWKAERARRAAAESLNPLTNVQP